MDAPTKTDSSTASLQAGDVVSVVVPAFNEARRIQTTLQRVDGYLSTRLKDYEILVVDDGSTDPTADVVRAAGLERVRLVGLDRNRGKGAAVRTGMLEARGNLLLLCDADLSTPIEEIEGLAKAIRDGASVAIGSRALPTSNIQIHQPWYREMMGRSFNKIVSMMAFGGIRDTQCGFKLFTREAARDLFGRQTIDGFAFDVEVLLLARGRYRIAEVPVAWAHADASRVSPLWDAAGMFRDVIRISLRHRLSRLRQRQ